MASISALSAAIRPSTPGAGALERATEARRSKMPVGGGAPAADGADGASFDDVLNKAVAKIDGVSKVADSRAIDFISGEDVAVHDVMAAVTEAEMAVQLTTAITVKALQAYQEIWRMDV